MEGTELRCTQLRLLMLRSYFWNSDLPEAIVTAGDDERAVAVKVDSGNWVRVGRKRLERLSRFDVPNPDAFIK